VGEAADGREAISRARESAPDVVLMDVRMPGMDGIEATGELLAAAPQARVVILTTFEDDEYVFGALAAGASGFLLKRTRPEELIAGIQTVAEGDALLSPAVTPREREVLELVARGLSNREIAAELVVEESTVKTHVRRVLMKLRLRDRVQAVIAAYESGLVRPGSPRSDE
jgi:DNA-binding NarL/FixJ family response regulator